MITNTNISTLLTNLKAVSAEGKITFVMNAKAAGEGKFFSFARVTSQAEQINIAFPTEGGKDAQAKAFTVDCKRFIEVAESLSSFEKGIDMKVADGILTLSVEEVAEIKLPVMESDPERQFQSDADTTVLTVDAKALTTLLRRGGFAADKNASREQAKNVTIKVTYGEAKTLQCFSTNGSVVAFSKAVATEIKTESKAETADLGLPAEQYAKLLRLISASGANVVKFMFNAKEVCVNVGYTVYQFTLSNNVFNALPFIEQWANAVTDSGATVDSEALSNVLKVLKVADEKAVNLILRTAGDKVELTTEATNNKATINASEKEGSFEPDTTVGDKEVVAGINANFLNKAISNLNKGNVTIKTVTDISFPFIISNGSLSETDGSSIAFIMKAQTK